MRIKIYSQRKSIEVEFDSSSQKFVFAPNFFAYREELGINNSDADRRMYKLIIDSIITEKTSGVIQVSLHIDGKTYLTSDEINWQRIN